MTSRGKLVLQPLLDRRKDKLAHIAAQGSNLSNDRSRDELVLIGGRQKEGLHIGHEIAIHSGHLKLVFKVGHGAKTSNNHAGILSANEVSKETLKSVDLNIGIVAKNLSGNGHSFLKAEERLFRAAVGHAHDNPIKELGGPSNEVFMSARQGVESAWIHSDGHHEAS